MWQMNKMYGFGELTYENGSEHKGYFKNDLKHGKGDFYLNKDKQFHGEWQDDKLHGLA